MYYILDVTWQTLDRQRSCCLLLIINSCKQAWTVHTHLCESTCHCRGGCSRMSHSRVSRAVHDTVLPRGSQRKRVCVSAVLKAGLSGGVKRWKKRKSLPTRCHSLWHVHSRRYRNDHPTLVGRLCWCGLAVCGLGCFICWLHTNIIRNLRAYTRHFMCRLKYAAKLRIWSIKWGSEGSRKSLKLNIHVFIYILDLSDLFFFPGFI